MNSSMMKSFVVALFALLALVGCDVPEVEIVVSPEYQSAAIQVDFVKVQRSEVQAWLSMNIDDYFSPGSKFRDFAKQRGDIFTVYYNIPQKTFKGTIPGDDPAWETVQYENSAEQSFDVIVLADIPGASGDNPFDIRRKLIPLRKDSWSVSLMNRMLGKGIGKMVISITEGGITLDPAPTEK